MEFYTNPRIVDSFKSFTQELLARVNRYTNMTYADDPTIFAIESGNELLGPNWGDMNCPATWVRDIARYVKTLAPGKLFVDGTYGVNRTHLTISEVDIFSNHYYPVSVDKLKGDLEAVAGAGRAYFAGEYDWVSGSVSSLAEWFAVLEKSPAAAGDAFWSLFGRNVPDCTVSLLSLWKLCFFIPSNYCSTGLIMQTASR